MEAVDSVAWAKALREALNGLETVESELAAHPDAAGRAQLESVAADLRERIASLRARPPAAGNG